MAGAVPKLKRELEVDADATVASFERRAQGATADGAIAVR